jgi:hypothetical protein
VSSAKQHNIHSNCDTIFIDFGEGKNIKILQAFNVYLELSFPENLIHGEKIMCPDGLKLSSAEQCLFLGDRFLYCLYL